MNSVRIFAFLIYFAFQPALMAHSFAGVECAASEAAFVSGMHLNPPDTIYRIDTVYQYIIVYDTIFYDDIHFDNDSLSLNDVVKNDSTTSGRRNFNYKPKLQRDDNSSHGESVLLPQSEFSAKPDSSLHNDSHIMTTTSDVRQKSSKRKKEYVQNDMNKKILHGIQLPLKTLQDTVFIFDTIVKHETIFDTMFYANSENTLDTTILHYTDFNRSGQLVIVKHTVKFTVRRQESIIKKTNKPVVVLKPTSHAGILSTTTSKLTQSVRQKFFIRTRQAHHPHQDLGVQYISSFHGGFSVDNPSLHFYPTFDEYEKYTEYLNQNTQNRSSWSLFLTHNFFRNRFGIETGAGVVRTNFLFNHRFNAADVDTNYYWQYFQRDFYNYDTTWYINIDTLLQTGNILLIPKIDSTLFSSTDSVYNVRYDTTLTAKNTKYRCSTTQLEILLNGRYLLNYGNFSIHLVAGLIPSFLISKTGQLPVYESVITAKTSNVSFDFGFNLTAYGAVSLHYNFYGNFGVFAEPFIKRNLISTLKNEEFTLRSNCWGIKFGLSYRLFSTKHQLFR